LRRRLAEAVLRLGVRGGGLVVGAAQPVAGRVALVVEGSGRPGHGLWGLHAVSLSRGEPVFAFQADSFFVPASTVKLFSTTAALMRLGPDYRFRTTVVASAAPDNAGVICGDVRLVGGGDPTLSGRPFPYRRDSPPGNPMEQLLELAEAVENGFAFAPWCGSAECEAKVKEDTKATTRCIPFEQPAEVGPCVVCGQPAEKQVLFARAY